MKIRVGFGFDVHQLVAGRELWLGGIRLEHEKDCWGTRMQTCSSILSVTHCWERRICATSAIIFPILPVSSRI